MDKIILGGGIGGLSAAHYLLKRFPTNNITIVEETERVGGWLSSIRREDGVIFEQGARTLRPTGEAGANTLQLIENLNLGEAIRPVFANEPAAKNRMIYANKTLHTLPSNMTSLFRTQKPFSQPLIKYLLNDVFAPKNKFVKNDESVYDFAVRRFGKEVGDYLVSPMVCGICGGDAKQISVKFLMENLFESERRYGSVARGLIGDFFQRPKPTVPSSDLLRRSKYEKWSIYTFSHGMEMLPKTLYKTCHKLGVKFKLDTKCTDITFGDSIAVTLNDNQIHSCDRLISAIPANRLSEAVKKQHPHLAKLLSNIETVSIGVVNLRYPRKVLQRDAFGFLVPPKEKLPILGVIFDSCCYPCGKNTVLTVMLGGHWFKQHFGDRPHNDFIYNIALENVNKILGISTKPSDFNVAILEDCIPQYKVGHQENLQRIEDYIVSNNLKLSLCGASYTGVGINDVILSSRRLVDQL